MKEIEERSLLYEEMKHYFILNFPQRPGALKEFVNDVLGPQDDITKFEYLKTSQNTGTVIIGIQLKNHDDLNQLKLMFMILIHQIFILMRIKCYTHF